MIRQEKWIHKSSQRPCSTQHHNIHIPQQKPPYTGSSNSWCWANFPTVTDSCSVYTNDSELQNQFHAQSLWSQMMLPPRIPSAGPLQVPFQNSAAHLTSPEVLPPSAGPLDDDACALPPTTEMTREAEIAAKEETACSGTPWADQAGLSDAVEWSDAWPLGSVGAPDPFMLDWPEW